MLKICGASDDLVELEGIGKLVKACLTCGQEIDNPTKRYGSSAVVGEGSEEIGSGDVMVVVGGNLSLDESIDPSPTGGIHVRMRYGRFGVGCWSAEVCQIDEDVPIPWPVSIKHGGRGYSVVVEIDAPDGTPVRWK